MNLRIFTIAVLALVAILSLGYAGYTSINPTIMTITQQQFMTNTQILPTTQTQTMYSTTTNIQTVINTATLGSGYTVNYQNCGYNGCNYYYAPPAYASVNDLCESISQNETIQCSGYIYTPSGACIQLAIPYSNPEWLEATAYLYVTLYNLPANHPSSGWVTVTGQLNQGFGSPSYGPYYQSCLGDYLNVSTIS